MNKNFKKIARYIKIYGIKRTFIKVAGRKRFLISLPNFNKQRNISFIGCGQFAFSTIAYFLYFKKKNNFLGCYDIDIVKSETLAKFYGFKKVYETFKELIDDKDCTLIYIASNHSSHTLYAIEAVNKNIPVYIEKPVSTTIEQFKTLLASIKKSKGEVFVGYNRPFSKSIIKLKQSVIYLENDVKRKSSFSVNYFVSGHKLPENHWYRNPEEGTRICGNMGHWIDLSIHILTWRSLPDSIFVNVIYSNENEPDDNLTVTLTTDKYDLFILTLTSRTEPFEGIDETINFQFANIIAKIDDFSKIKIWQNDKLYSKRYWPKDVGHEKAILQPFNKSGFVRNIDEVFLSTKLMLFIKDMVLERKRHEEFKINDEIENIYYQTGYKLFKDVYETNNTRFKKR